MNKQTILISPQNHCIYNYFRNRYNIIKSDCVDNFVTYEQYHADMQMLNLNGKLFVNSTCTNVIAKLEALNVDFTVCNDIGKKYPESVALNAALIGTKLFCNRKSLHAEVKKYCDLNNIEIINVKQGYTKCSTLILNDSAIITDDNNIDITAQQEDISVLKISKGDIYLSENAVGFIGGASAKIGNTVYFFGDISKCRDYIKITDFIEKHGLSIDIIKSCRLSDIGGIVLINL